MINKLLLYRKTVARVIHSIARKVHLNQVATETNACMKSL